MSDIRPHGRELLDAARRERTPGAADRERVFGALMAGAALSTAASATAAPAVAKLLTGVSKWLVLAGLAGAVTGAVYVAGHVGGKAPVARTTPVAGALAVGGALLPKVEPEASAAAAAAVPAPSLEPAPTTTPHASVAKAGSEPPSLDEELTGLRAAHAAYQSGNAARALALLAAHQARFPKSQLATERSTLEVLSLCGVGRTRDAKKLATKLRKTAGSAAALSGLDGSCAAE